ncbi:NUDIX domain-containing protein [Nonomuraea mesophila]|uniref:NUDIX domain-containing protein n=1 Tax=Nonomuraea mesophila TaxID=2530382 RepID=A0A4R5EVQ2_9ACTN|nr:NUDIX hydrolase [Nonomuraea mesophila]TDE38807.1 NUDIX domain-containing protein [Nonomuraea mesophila]
MITRELRVSAYAICVEDGRILLARWVGPAGERLWTLPGGGLDHGEDPVDAAIREVEEETGYTVAIDTLLGISTLHRPYPRGTEGQADFHGVRVMYEGHITGGALRHEIGGSTDRAAWIPLAEVSGLERSEVVDAGLALHRDRPPHGRVAGP